MDDPPIRLTLVDLSSGIGLAERSLWELATRLRPDRYAVRVWLSAATEHDGMAEVLRERACAVERFTPAGSRWDWKTPFGQWLQLRRERPQLVHVHHAPGAGSLRVARLAAADGLPVVITCHAPVPPAAEDPHTLRVYERADFVTTQTHADSERLVREWGLERDRVRPISYGADLPDEEAEGAEARAWRAQLGVRPGRPLWVCPLRLDRSRGQQVLLEALAALAGRGVPFVVALVGEGPDRAALERRAIELGLERHVRFVEGAPVGPLLTAADAVVLPAIDGPVPLTLLDALARGCPVVASALPGIDERVRDGIDGRLVPPGDAPALAAALEELHRRPEVAAHLGRTAAARAGEELPWSRVVASFEDVYDDVLGLASFVPAGASPPRG